MIDEQTLKLNNKEVEREVIAAIMYEPNIYYMLQDTLNAELFSDYDSKKAYQAIKDMADEGKQPDYMELVAILQKEGVQIGTFLTGNAYSGEVTKQRVRYLEDLSIRRRLLALFYKGQTMATDQTITIEELQTLSKDLDNILTHQQGEEEQHFGEIVKGLMNDVADRMNDVAVSGMLTGLRLFDSRYGWHGGDLIIIAGAPSAGKSTLATTIAYNMAERGVPVAYYSMEMSAKQLTARIIARRTQVSSSTTLYGKLSDAEYSRLYDGTMEMANLPIYFDEDSKTSFSRIRGSIRRMVKRYGVKVVFLDYMQILANGADNNREQLLGDMARDLKRDAVELDIAVCALSQLNRSGDRVKEPNLSQMRGSGQIEEACDSAVLLHRPSQTSDYCNLLLSKGRNVGTGKDRVKFNRHLSYFSDYEAGDIDKPYNEEKEQLPF